ncbi:MAG: hypothetical protein HYS17_04420 [Micavibrio aeruginosavorus]|uniref:Uncharacterized protein n=1 Tax=Micavibrio aeruginosavorus TaxID=349221 RepID=A0A7T5R403_9BACT|nr:MAG: hypothetical protein HYS17_04420 [Micavibrio aeruginosavorus]
MPASIRTAYELDFDTDFSARQDNLDRLAHITTAYMNGSEINFPATHKHMRFSWKRASAPLGDLLESLYGYFNGAAEVSVAGGGTHPFDRESVHLSVDLKPVTETISRDGVGNGLALLGRYLEDPAFQAICEQNQVDEVYTPSNDLKVRAHKVMHHNHPRPL